jgi:hypothetical protein
MPFIEKYSIFVPIKTQCHETVHYPIITGSFGSGGCYGAGEL